MAHTFDPVHHAVDSHTLEFPGIAIQLPSWLSKFMLFEVIAAAIICAIFIPLARHVAANPWTTGRFRNAMEGLVVFIRDKVVKQGIHHSHDANRLLPFFLTTFLFILVNNLLGLVPGGATPTANINVTAVLALSVVGVVLYEGMRKSGVVGFWLNLVPHLDVAPALKVFLWPMLFLIELLSFVVKHSVLALRLFANMMAGHVVLAVVLGFLITVPAKWFWAVMPFSVAGSTALMTLELFVACLQAYVFCLLSSLFIGSAIDPNH